MKVNFSIFIITCLFYACKPPAPSAKELELLQKEKGNPAMYIRLGDTTMASANDHYIIDGRVANFAFAARFKNIVITTTLYDKNGQQMEQKKDDTLFEYWEPRASKPFSIKVNAPRPPVKFRVEFKSAEVKE